MAEPAAPTSLSGEKMGYGHTPTGTAAIPRIVNPSVAGTAVNTSGAQAVASMVLHDDVDDADEGPVKIGGYAKAAAPTAVSADADRVAAWFGLNGDQRTSIYGGVIAHDAADSGGGGPVKIGGKANAAAPSAVSEDDRVNSWHGLNGDLRVSLYGGVVAHDGVDSGGAGPVKIGGRAQAPTADPEEVADDDRVDAFFDRNGRLAVHAGQVPKTAAINCASSGDNTIISAVAGKKIAVWAWNIIVEGAVDVRWEDGAAGTAKSGQYAFTEAGRGIAQAAGGLVPLWIGTSNTLLNLELSGAVQVMGQISYTEWDD